MDFVQLTFPPPWELASPGGSVYDDARAPVARPGVLFYVVTPVSIDLRAVCDSYEDRDLALEPPWGAHFRIGDSSANPGFTEAGGEFGSELITSSGAKLLLIDKDPDYVRRPFGCGGGGRGILGGLRRLFGGGGGRGCSSMAQQEQGADQYCCYANSTLAVIVTRASIKLYDINPTGKNVWERYYYVIVPEVADPNQPSAAFIRVSVDRELWRSVTAIDSANSADLYTETAIAYNHTPADVIFGQQSAIVKAGQWFVYNLMVPDEFVGTWGRNLRVKIGFDGQRVHWAIGDGPTQYTPEPSLVIG